MAISKIAYLFYLIHYDSVCHDLRKIEHISGRLMIVVIIYTYNIMSANRKKIRNVYLPICKILKYMFNFKICENICNNEKMNTYVLLSLGCYKM